MSRRAFAFFDVDGTLLDDSTEGIGGPLIVAFGLWMGGDDASRVARLTPGGENPTGPSRLQVNRMHFEGYRGLRRAWLQRLATTWARLQIGSSRRIYNPNVLAEMEALRRAGVAPVLVSGSWVDLVRPFADDMGINHVLATRLQTDEDGVFTGRIVPPQMIGDGKREALLRFLPADVRASDCFAFGDHPSDLPMLGGVGHPGVVAGNPELEREARRRHWPIIARRR